MRTLIRNAILALALSAGLAPAFAQVPAPVPALPDAERRTSYSISGTTCACAVNFSLYGDSTDYQNWVEVFLNGVRVNFNDSTFGWTLTTPSGSFASLARPITNAVLTFNSVQTGTVQIVGARRPRRTTQFQENIGVPTRNLNLAFSDLTAQTRELWDKTNDVTGRAILGLPGESIAPLPSAAARKSSVICWDATGLIPMACAALNGLGNVVGPNSATDGHIAVFSGTTGQIVRDGGLIGIGNVTGPGVSTDGAFALFNGTTGAVIKMGPTIIPMASGGTAAALTAANGGLVYSTGAALAILAPTATANQIAMSGSSAAPAWSTATYPATTTANQLLWSSGTNAIAGLATANNGILITSGAGVPSISSTLPAAVQGNITTVGTIGTGVWGGTAVAVAFGGTGGSSASGTLLDNITGFSSTGYVKRTGAGAYTLNNPIPLADGGSNASLAASNGGLVYSTGSAMAILSGTGTPGQIPLSGTNSAPGWSTTTWPSTISVNNLLWSSGSNAVVGLATANNGVLVTSGAGVPSISSTLPTAAQSNITQLGTIGAGVWNGTAITGSFIASNTVSNSNLAQAIGPTIKGNPTASTANLQDFTIQGLTNKSIPNANNDFLLLYDATSGAFRSVTPGQLASGGTAGVGSLNGLTGNLSITQGNGVSISSGGSSVTVAGPTVTPQGRLTLTSATPVMTTSTAAQTTVYYTPYVGSYVPMYDGTNMVPIAVPEISQATTDTTQSPAAVANSSCYDLFVWNPASPKLSRGPLWTNTTTRSAGTALTLVNGIYLNSVSITNGPAASRGTWVGTMCSNGTAAIDYIFGGIATGGLAGSFQIWNAYNRVPVVTFVGDSTSSWGYAVATTWRAANGSATMRVNFVVGLPRDGVSAEYIAFGQAGSGATSAEGVGFNSTTAFCGTTAPGNSVTFENLVGKCSTIPALGLNFFSAIEFNSNTTSSSWIGANGTSFIQTGMHASLWQ